MSSTDDSNVAWRDILQVSIDHRPKVVPPYGDLRRLDQLSSYIGRREEARSATINLGSRPSRAQRPAYGQLSRNHPHPMRVRHFKGFLDMPICGVFDCYPSTPGLVELKPFSPSIDRRRPFTTDSGSNSKALIDTTKRHQNTGVILADWRHELHALTVALGLLPSSTDDIRPSTASTAGDDGPIRSRSSLRQSQTVSPERAVSAGGANLFSSSRPCTRSSSTGSAQRPSSRRCLTARLDVTSFYRPTMSRTHSSSSLTSRTTSRLARTSSSRHSSTGSVDVNVAETEAEHAVLRLLCQLLNVDDVGTAHAWLLTASDNDKALILELIRTALTRREATPGGERRERSVTARTPLDLLPNSPANISATLLPSGEIFDRLTLGSVSRPSTSAILHQGTIVTEAGAPTETGGDRYQTERTHQTRMQSASATMGDINIADTDDHADVSDHRDVKTSTGLLGYDCHDNLVDPGETSDTNQSGGQVYHEEQHQQPLKMRYAQTAISRASIPAAI